jgi:hypothetical protein
MVASIRGGNGTDNGGLFNEYGGHGHYWCELSAGGMTFYIDIAAEQFDTLLSLSKMPMTCRTFRDISPATKLQ